MNNAERKHAAVTSLTFKRRERVTVRSATGRAELATIVRPDRTLAGWYVVRFNDGSALCVCGSSLSAA